MKVDTNSEPRREYKRQQNEKRYAEYGENRNEETHKKGEWIHGHKGVSGFSESCCRQNVHK